MNSKHWLYTWPFLYPCLRENLPLDQYCTGREKFFEKNSKKKRKMRILKQSHSAKKLDKGDPLGFLKLQLAAKYQKTFCPEKYSLRSCI